MRWEFESPPAHQKLNRGSISALIKLETKPLRKETSSKVAGLTGFFVRMCNSIGLEYSALNREVGGSIPLTSTNNSGGNI